MSSSVQSFINPYNLHPQPEQREMWESDNSTITSYRTFASGTTAATVTTAATFASRDNRNSKKMNGTNAKVVFGQVGSDYLTASSCTKKKSMYSRNSKDSSKKHPSISNSGKNANNSSRFHVREARDDDDDENEADDDDYDEIRENNNSDDDQEEEEDKENYKLSLSDSASASASTYYSDNNKNSIDSCSRNSRQDSIQSKKFNQANYSYTSIDSNASKYSSIKLLSTNKNSSLVNKFWATLSVHAASSAILSGGTENCARIAADSLLEDGQAMNKINDHRLQQRLNSRGGKGGKQKKNMEPMKITSQTVRNAATKASIALLQGTNNVAVAAKVAEVIIREGNALLEEMAMMKNQCVEADQSQPGDHGDNKGEDDHDNRNASTKSTDRKVLKAKRNRYGSDNSNSASSSSSSKSTAFSKSASLESNSSHHQEGRAANTNTSRIPQDDETILSFSTIVTDATSVRLRGDKYATDMDSVASPRNNDVSGATSASRGNKQWEVGNFRDDSPSIITQKKSSNDCNMETSSFHSAPSREEQYYLSKKDPTEQDQCDIDPEQRNETNNDELERKKAIFDAAALALRQKLDDLERERDHPPYKGNVESWEEEYDELESYYNTAIQTSQRPALMPQQLHMMAIPSIATPLHHGYNNNGKSNEDIIDYAHNTSQSISIMHHGYSNDNHRDCYYSNGKEYKEEDELEGGYNDDAIDYYGDNDTQLSIRSCLRKPSKAFPLVDTNEPSWDDGSVLMSIGECRIHMTTEDIDKKITPTNNVEAIGIKSIPTSNQPPSHDLEEEAVEAIEVVLFDEEPYGARTPTFRDKFKGFFRRRGGKKVRFAAAMDCVDSNVGNEMTPKSMASNTAGSARYTDEEIPPPSEHQDIAPAVKSSNLPSNKADTSNSNEISSQVKKQNKGARRIRSFFLNKASKMRKNRLTASNSNTGTSGSANYDFSESDSRCSNRNHNNGAEEESPDGSLEEAVKNANQTAVDIKSHTAGANESIAAQSVHGDFDEGSRFEDDGSQVDAEVITLEASDSYTTAADTYSTLNKRDSCSVQTDGASHKGGFGAALDRFIMGEDSRDCASQATSQSSKTSFYIK